MTLNLLKKLNEKKDDKKEKVTLGKKTNVIVRPTLSDSETSGRPRYANEERIIEEDTRNEWLQSVSKIHKMRVELAACGDGDPRRQILMTDIENAVTQHSKMYEGYVEEWSLLTEIWGRVNPHRTMDHKEHFDRAMKHNEQYHAHKETAGRHRDAAVSHRKGKGGTHEAKQHEKAARSSDLLSDMHRRSRNREMAWYFHKAPDAEVKNIKLKKAKKFLDESLDPAIRARHQAEMKIAKEKMNRAIHSGDREQVNYWRTQIRAHKAKVKSVSPHRVR